MKIGHKCAAVMIDETLKIYKVKVASVAQAFEGTLIDGELTLENGLLVYKAFDIIWASGLKMTGTNLVTRSRLLHRILNDFSDLDVPSRAMKGCLVSRGNNRSMRFESKPWYSVSHLSKVNDLIETAGHETYDGLIFSAINAPLTPGRRYDMLKYKIHHTLDLLFKFQPSGDFKMYCGGDRGTLAELDIVEYDGAHIKLMVQDTPALTKIQCLGLYNSAVFECRVSKTENLSILLIEPLFIRTDKKTKPNHLFTVKGTMPAIMNNLTILSIVQMIDKNSKRDDGWKLNLQHHHTASNPHRPPVRATIPQSIHVSNSSASSKRTVASTNCTSPATSTSTIYQSPSILESSGSHSWQPIRSCSVR